MFLKEWKSVGIYKSGNSRTALKTDGCRSIALTANQAASINAGGVGND